MAETHTSSSRRVLDVRAHAGSFDQRTQSGSLSAANGTFYRDGTAAAIFAAPAVDADQARKTVVGRGGVVVHSVSPPGLTLTADLMTWRVEQNVIVARGRVYLEKKEPRTGKILAWTRADSLKINTGLQTFYIPGPPASAEEEAAMKRGSSAIGTVSGAAALAGSAIVLASATGSAQAHSHTHSGAALKAYRRPAPRQPRQAGQGPLVFGDVQIGGYSSLSGSFTDKVTANGPNVTVTSTDSSTGAVSRLTARKIVAHMGKNQAVDRVEAEGGVHFDGQRPATSGKGTLTFNGSGSSGVWYKQAGRVELEGPVQYYAEQPNAGAEGKQWVRGTAASTTYDEVKQVLTLTGSARAKVYDPAAMKPGTPADIAADRITLDLSGPSVQFDLRNSSPGSGRVEIHPKPEQQKQEPH